MPSRRRIVLRRVTGNRDLYRQIRAYAGPIPNPQRMIREINNSPFVPINPMTQGCIAGPAKYCRRLYAVFIGYLRRSGRRALAGRWTQVGPITPRMMNESIRHVRDLPLQVKEKRHVVAVLNALRRYKM